MLGWQLMYVQVVSTSSSSAPVLNLPSPDSLFPCSFILALLLTLSTYASSSPPSCQSPRCTITFPCIFLVDTSAHSSLPSPTSYFTVSKADNMPVVLILRSSWIPPVTIGPITEIASTLRLFPSPDACCTTTLLPPPESWVAGAAEAMMTELGSSHRHQRLPRGQETSLTYLAEAQTAPFSTWPTPTTLGLVRGRILEAFPIPNLPRD